MPSNLLKLVLSFIFIFLISNLIIAQSNRTVTFTNATADFNAAEKYTASSGNVDYYVTFDATYIYFGAFRTSSSTWGLFDHFTIYVDADPTSSVTSGGNGTTTGETWDGNTPTLPFQADYRIAIRANSSGESFYSSYGGASWTTGTANAQGWTQNTSTSSNGGLEVRIPWSDLGNPDGIYFTMYSSFNTGFFAPAPGSFAGSTLSGYFGGIGVTSADCSPTNTTNTPITALLTNSVPAASGLYAKVVVNTGTVTATNDFNIASGGSIVVSGGTFDVSGRSIQLGGTTIGTGKGATINTSGTGVLTTNSSTVFTFNGEGSIVGNNLTSAAKFTINRKFTPLSGGGFTIDNGGVLEINNNAFVSTHAPTYNSGSILKYNSGTTPYGRTTEWSATSGAGYPYHVWVTNNTGLDVGNGSPTVARQMAGNLTIDAGSGFYMDYASNDMTQAVTVIGNLVLAGNLSLSDVSGGDLKIGGNWTHTTGTFDPSARAVFFNAATGDQTITNASGEVFDYLIIDKSTSGNVILANNVTVNQTLTLTSGLINTSSSALLTIASTGSTTGGNTISYINGPLAKIGNSAFVFPVGKAGKFAKIEISAPSASSTFTAEYFKTSPSNRSNLGSGLTGGIVSSVEYWELGPASGTPSANVTLHWNDNSFTGISSASSSDLVVAHYTSGNWISEGNSANLYGLTGYVTSNSVSTWSPFAFGTPSNVNLLPVKLISFAGNLLNNDVKLNWTTASEKNNDYFDIERSMDGVNFQKIGMVKGIGNATNIHDYSYIDFDATELAIPYIYYRLKQVDYNSNYEYSSIIKIKVGESGKTLLMNVQPNPFSESVFVNYFLPEKGSINIRITDAQGQVHKSIEGNRKKGWNNEEFNTTLLSKGIYFITVSYNGVYRNYKLVVKN